MQRLSAGRSNNLLHFGEMLHVFACIASVSLILGTLLDGFETILLPRRINHRFRYSRFYYRMCWQGWRRLSTFLVNGKWRESMLSVFGPSSLLGLFGSWISSLVFGFALLQWSLSGLTPNGNGSRGPTHFWTDLYFSGTTYFTLGLGDVVPVTRWSRLFTAVEGGLGFGFLAIIISYLPVLYQAFSKRELTISLLDARAGSPPSGGEFVRRLIHEGHFAVDDASLRAWEQWSAELLESHISFPVLGYYRSQHANQSWLAALTTMLDSCALLMTLLPPSETHQARLTFAMARHAAVDIALIFKIEPRQPSVDRLADRVTALREMQKSGGLATSDPNAIEARLNELRRLYEPFLEALATHFLLTLPSLIAAELSADNWQRSAWMPKTPGIGSLAEGSVGADHFG